MVARDPMQAASKDVLVEVIDQQTREPEVGYSTENPLGRNAKAIVGTLGAQFQNATKTVVTAYSKAADSDELVELSSTAPLSGDTTGGQSFSIPVTPAQLQDCPTIVLKATESSHPKAPSAAMPTAKDDAYLPSNEVAVPVCEQVVVTFDANGGTSAKPIAPVKVLKGDALGADFPTTTPVREGYTFKGWATAPDATAGNFDDSTVVNENTTVYAVWSTQAIDWGNTNGDSDGNLVTVPGNFDYGQQLTPTDYKTLIENSNKLPAGAVVSVSPEINTTPTDSAGHNQTVTVTVTFGDGSTLSAPVAVTINPASDSYSPVANAIDVEQGQQPRAGAITRAVTDANGKVFPSGTEITLKEPVDTSELGPTTGTVVVTYPDGSSDEVSIPINVVDTSDAATYDPAVDPITVPYGGDVPALETAVTNTDELPSATTYTDVTATPIDTTKPGEQAGSLQVNYPDGTSEIVPVTVVVQTAAASFDPQAAPIDVNLNEQPTAEQLLTATTIDGTNPLPAGPSVAIAGTIDTSVPGEIADVPVRVTYPDGTTDDLTITVNVIDNRTDAEKTPPSVVVQPVEIPYGGTLDAESGIANAAELPAGTTYTDVTEGGLDTTTPGSAVASVEVSYPDGSTATVDVPVKVLSAADTFTPEAAAVTVDLGGTVNAADTIANLADLPEGTTVALPPSFNTDAAGTQTVNVTVTYPDGSIDTVAVEITVVDNRTDAEKFPPIAAPRPIEIPYGDVLDATDGIVNKDELPAETTFEDVSDPAIDTTQPGEYTAKVKVTYPDDSSALVDVPVTVQTAADSFDPKPKPVEVEVGGTVDP
ncbi:MAG: Rib/alpha-like domain-containing protein, partial [Bowdeniella nasicola]|nr:Rib/alpha-like domain-containing protein [Bowdeniella nasicola]